VSGSELGQFGRDVKERILEARTLLPLVVLAVILAVDVWVYVDARVQAQRGRPVVFSLGAFVVDTPEMWFACCLILFVIFVPLYLAGRGR
jgi:hypothetical protein